MNVHIRDGGLGAVSAFIVSAIVCAYFHGALKPAEPGEPVKQIAHVQKETINCKPVIVYKAKAAKNLGVKLATKTHIAAAANIPFDGYPYRAIATYSDLDGNIDVLAQRLPLPLLSFDHHKDIGISYGFRDNSSAVWRLDGSYDLLNLKGIRIGATGNVDTSGGWFVGGRVRYSWR